MNSFNPYSSASSSDCTVGILLLTSAGTPARMALRTISTGTRPLVKSTHSASGTPYVRAQPTALSSALWRPRSSHRYKILPARSSRQLCTAWVAR